MGASQTLPVPDARPRARARARPGCPSLPTRPVDFLLPPDERARCP
eukprot:gene15572-21670_t